MAVSKWGADLGGLGLQIRGNVEGDVSFSASAPDNHVFGKLTPLEALALGQALNEAALAVLHNQQERRSKEAG